MSSRSTGAWRGALLRSSAENSPCITWLRERGSLTARLQKRGRFAVRLLRQELALPTRDEAALLGIKASARAWVREVALLCDGEVLVFAHSVLPYRPRGPMSRWLARLGSRSLGSLLFAHAGFARGEMNFRRLDARHPLFLPAMEAIDGGRKTLWARRSRFGFGAQAVLVTEVFSPALHGR